jgi:hypothetical protein
MSASPSRADMLSVSINVCKVPKADQPKAVPSSSNRTRQGPSHHCPPLLSRTGSGAARLRQEGISKQQDVRGDREARMRADQEADTAGSPPSEKRNPGSHQSG